MDKYDQYMYNELNNMDKLAEKRNSEVNTIINASDSPLNKLKVLIHLVSPLDSNSLLPAPRLAARYHKIMSGDSISYYVNGKGLYESADGQMCQIACQHKLDPHVYYKLRKVAKTSIPGVNIYKPFKLTNDDVKQVGSDLVHNRVFKVYDYFIPYNATNKHDICHDTRFAVTNIHTQNISSQKFYNIDYVIPINYSNTTALINYISTQASIKQYKDLQNKK